MQDIEPLSHAPAFRHTSSARIFIVGKVLEPPLIRMARHPHSVRRQQLSGTLQLCMCSSDSEVRRSLIQSQLLYTERDYWSDCPVVWSRAVLQNGQPHLPAYPPRLPSRTYI